MRNMAYIVTIKSIEPIEGKDRIVYVSFNENTYQVIAQKGFSVGDKVLYAEVDSILPVSPKFEFLKSRCYKENLNGFLIKAMKMSGLYSFGIIFKPEDLGIHKYSPGQDFTEFLNIRKYEPEDDKSPIENKLPQWKKNIKNFLMRYSFTRPIGRTLFVKDKVSGSFPTQYISKSDEDNLSNHPDWFNKFHDNPSYITVKIEGKSATIFFEKSKKIFSNNYIFNAFGRNTLLDPDSKKWMEDNYKSKLLNMNKSENKNYILQGEFCSPKVQKGIYKNGIHFYVYKMKDITSGKNIPAYEMFNLCKKYEFETVPLLNVTLKDFSSIEEIQKYSDTLYFEPGNNEIQVFTEKNKNRKNHEGIVVRSIDLNKNNWSFKVKSREYCL